MPRRVKHVVTKGDNEFTVDFEPVEGSEIVQIQGDKATVGYLSPDESSMDWYFGERDGGKYYGFDRNCGGYNPLDLEGIIELVRENRGRCFWIAKYEHSGVKYYRTGDAITIATAKRRPRTASAAGYCIPDQQWDVSPGAAIYVVPKDAGRPYSKYCDAIMEEFTDWCNGSIYGVCTQQFTREEDGSWKPGESDECWDYIGYQYAEETLKDNMEGSKA